MAWAIAALFGSLPVGARLLFGGWAFQEAGEIAILLLVAGTYFYIVSVRIRVLPDPAAMLDQAIQFAAAGRPDRAIKVLTKTIRQSPRFWQAYQYRGQLYLHVEDASAALRDFSEAIRLAPDEPALHELRNRASSLLGGAADETLS